MKGVKCYELFRGIALKNHAFSFFKRKINVIMLNKRKLIWKRHVTILKTFAGVKFLYI